MIDGGVTGPFDIKFLDSGLLEEAGNGHIRLTVLGHVYFVAVVGEYARTLCPFDMQIDDEIAFHEELGLIEVRDNLVRPRPLGLSKVFVELEFDETGYENAVEILRAHPEFEKMVHIRR
jgi:hypothetical protein